MRNYWIFLIVMSLCSFASCNSNSTDKVKNGDNNSARNLQIVATTGQIHDALENITQGANVKIKLFCGPGIDPHSFSASTQDVQAMEDADAIFFNGFHLEAKLDEMLHDRYKDKAWSMASAFPSNHRLDWKDDGQIDANAPFDPHIWNHLPGWAVCVKELANQMAKVDPKSAELYRKNGEAYVDELNGLHKWAQQQLAKLPEDRKFLVSAHDAFNYFAKVYGLETVAVLGVGNDPEADIQTMRNVSTLICEKKVPVIFMESITNPKITKALQEACEARGWNVKIATQTLYSDDLGESPPSNTFLGAFRSNVQVIFDSLKK